MGLAFVFIFCAIVVVPAAQMVEFFESRRVASREFKSRKFRATGSNPRVVAYFDLSMPFKSSSLPRAGTIFLDCTFESRPYLIRETF